MMEDDKFSEALDEMYTALELESIPEINTMIDVLTHCAEHKSPFCEVIRAPQGAGKSTLLTKLRNYFAEVGWNTFDLPLLYDPSELVYAIAGFCQAYKKGVPTLITVEMLDHQPVFLGKFLNRCAKEGFALVVAGAIFMTPTVKACEKSVHGDPLGLDDDDLEDEGEEDGE